MAKESKRILVLGALLAASCSPIVDNRGHATQTLDMSQVTPGTSRKADVQAVLGSPSMQSDYGNVWYYVSVQKETAGILAPQVTKQQAVAIRFDEGGTVEEIETYDKEDGKPVALVGKNTPSAGHSLTFMEQLMSNFGKFATPGRQIDPGRGY